MLHGNDNKNKKMDNNTSSSEQKKGSEEKCFVGSRSSPKHLESGNFSSLCDQDIIFDDEYLIPEINNALEIEDTQSRQNSDTTCNILYKNCTTEEDLQELIKLYIDPFTIREAERKSISTDELPVQINSINLESRTDEEDEISSGILSQLLNPQTQTEVSPSYSLIDPQIYSTGCNQEVAQYMEFGNPNSTITSAQLHQVINQTPNDTLPSFATSFSKYNYASASRFSDAYVVDESLPISKVCFSASSVKQPLQFDLETDKEEISNIEINSNLIHDTVEHNTSDPFANTKMEISLNYPEGSNTCSVNKLSSLSKNIVVDKSIGGKSFICNVCDKKYKNKQSLRIHMTLHTREKLFECHVCDKKFLQKRYLLAHSYVHTNERPFKCHVCGFKFCRAVYLAKHLKIHNTVEKLFICKLCRNKYKVKEYLAQHMKTHCNEKLFHCTVCNRHFGTSKNLQNHFKTIHSREDRYNCDICSKKFYYYYSLQIHLQYHADTLLESITNEKLFVCHQCGKHYISQRILNFHLKYHKKRELIAFTCAECGENYCEKRCLKRHIFNNCKKPHLRIFICDVCGNTYTTNGSLTRHMKYHTGKNLLICNVCSKQCVNKNVLEAHFRIHSGEKPFSCETCGKKFTYKCNLNKHKKICIKKKLNL